MLKLKSVIKAPENSVIVGLGLAAAVYVVYQSALPTHADIRTAQPNNQDIESARRAAAWKSATLIALVFMITHDVTSATISGAALAGVDLMVKHSNGVNPSTGSVFSPTQDVAPVENDTAFAMPDYDEDSDDQGGGF